MPNEPNLPQSRKLQKIQKSVLIILSICISLFGWLRLSGAIQVYRYILQLEIDPHPIYYVLSGLIIGVGFLIAVIASAFSAQWSFKYLRVCSSFVTAHLLIENLFLHAKPNLAQLICILFVLILFFLLTRNKRENQIEHANEKIIAGNRS